MSQLQLQLLADIRKRAVYLDCEMKGAPQQAVFLCYDLGSDPENFEHEPAVQISFSGFQCLGADVEVVHQFKLLGDDKQWTMLGFGSIAFSARVLNNKEKGKWESEDSTWIKSLMARVTSVEFGLDTSPVALSCKLLPEEPQVVYFILSKLVTEEEWNQAYQAKSLEFTAATKYFEHVKGVSLGESPLPPDVSFNRTLN